MASSQTGKDFMEWSDDALVLGLRPFGENGAILEALTRQHGRHLGLLRSATSRRTRGILEPGNLLEVQWRARIDQQLGNYTVELVAARAAHFFEDSLKLSGLSAVCVLCSATLPEREVHERVFLALDELLGDMSHAKGVEWIKSYIRFELLLLEDLGFGLDLSVCAVTGDRNGLCFVSPKTGRAVTKAGAGSFAARLLPLPGFLIADGASFDLEQARHGAALTGHFLERFMHDAHGKALPEAHQRFRQKIQTL